MFKVDTNAVMNCYDDFIQNKIDLNNKEFKSKSDLCKKFYLYIENEHNVIRIDKSNVNWVAKTERDKTLFLLKFSY